MSTCTETGTVMPAEGPSLLKRAAAPTRAPVDGGRETGWCIVLSGAAEAKPLGNAEATQTFSQDVILSCEGVAAWESCDATFA